MERTTESNSFQVISVSMMKVAAILLALALTGTANASLIADLESDWTNGSLPSTPGWVFREDATAISAVSNILGVDSFPVTQPAYQGDGNFPVWFKSEFDGSAFSNPVGIDWTTGDVVVHTDGVASTSAVWTSTFDGVISIQGSLWNPRNFGRFQNYSVTLSSSGTILSGIVDDTTDRSNRETFGASGIAVSVGDEIALSLSRGNIDDYVGVSFSISHDVPVPATFALVGLGLVILRLRRGV